MACYPGIALLVLVLFAPGEAAGSGPPRDTHQQKQKETAAEAQEPSVEPMDVRDLLRALRHKPPDDGRDRKMLVVAPYIATSPATGFTAGAAGAFAFFRGDPATTRISSLNGSASVSARQQVMLSGKFVVFWKDDRALVLGDNRLQWTSEDTYALGTSAGTAAQNVDFTFVRVYETVYRRLRPSLFAGAGLHLNVHGDVRAGEGADAGWEDSAYVTYSEAHGLPIDSQTSGGASLNLLFDSRDNPINASRGWLASASYRGFFKGFLGGDSTWQELYLDARTYRPLTADGRHRLAFWLLGDLVAGGIVPYLDLPGTGKDTFGRSARGYAAGRFRGERMLYGEVEYRVSLLASGLLGAVAFLNTTTLTNLQAGERLFDSFATGAGGGLRLLMDKRSRTNLCVDIGWGRSGSRGIYLAVQEAF